MCLSPVGLTREIAGRKYTTHVPCGKCNQCLSLQQNEYVVRSVEESKKKGNVWFFTLTYRNDNVPITFDLDGEIKEENPETGEVFFADSARLLTLDRQDIVDWKKRCREKINRARKKAGQPRVDFSYMICGEYGPQTHRPHYHGLFIGLTKEEVSIFEEDWKQTHGYTCFKYIPTIPKDGVNQVEATARYVAKYICKLDALEEPLVKEKKVQKPRKMVSVGYGMPTKKRFDAMRRYHLCEDLFPNLDIDKVYNLSVADAKRLVREVIKRNKYKNNGKETKLPRYYKRKMFYIKDPFSGKVRASSLQQMVSHTMEMDVRKDYSRKLAEIASNYEDGDPDTAYFRATRDLQKSEDARRQEMSETIFATNLKYIRKSKF